MFQHSPLSDTTKFRVIVDRDTITTKLSQPPVPVGGFSFFYSSISRLFEYPRAAIDNGISGVMVLGFTVTERGTVENPVVIKDIGYDTKQALLKLFTTMPSRRWIPGKLNDKNVRVFYTVPVSINISVR